MDNETLARLRKALKGKRARFVEEYVIDGNGTEAVIRAGITENRASAAVIASRYLLEPEVRAYRDALIEAAAEAVNVNKNNLIAKAEQIYRRCMQDQPKMQFNTVTGQWEPVGVYEFNPSGAAKATELQAKLTGNLTEKRKLNGGGFEIVMLPKNEQEAET